jgi:hypothetical protein
MEFWDSLGICLPIGAVELYTLAMSRGRTACRVSGHKLVSHAEQVPQDIGRDTGQANQHGVVVEMVVGRVVNVGSGFRLVIGIR